MTLQATIEAAMKERAPTLHRDLKAAGKLTAHVRDLAAQINSQVVDAVMAQRLAKKWDRLPPMELAKQMKGAETVAREIALSEALQFPPDGTSPPSPGATTA
jgi:hypothetical protein